MSIEFCPSRREIINEFLTNEVACGVIHLKNGGSFTFYNDSLKPLRYDEKNENTIMQAVCDINEKLNYI